MARSVRQLLPLNNDTKAAAAVVPAVFGVALPALCAVCSGPVSAFATPGTRNGALHVTRCGVRVMRSNAV